MKINKEIEKLKHYKPIRPNRHLENTLSNRIHILLKHKWNILQDRLCARTQNKHQQIENIQSMFSDHNRIKLEINYGKRNLGNL